MFKKISYKLVFVAFNFCLFIFCLELFSRMFFPETAPKNNLYFKNMQNNLKIGPKNLTLRQMKNSSDYNVEISFNSHLPALVNSASRNPLSNSALCMIKVAPLMNSINSSTIPSNFG